MWKIDRGQCAGAGARTRKTAVWVIEKVIPSPKARKNLTKKSISVSNFGLWSKQQKKFIIISYI
jgi:hypothetical protein